MFTGILALIILVLNVIAIVDVLRGSLPPLHKLLWILVILLFPVLGMLVYFLVGSKRL